MRIPHKFHFFNAFRVKVFSFFYFLVRTFLRVSMNWHENWATFACNNFPRRVGAAQRADWRMWVSRLHHKAHQACVLCFCISRRSVVGSLARFNRERKVVLHALQRLCASSFAGVEISNQIANFVYSLLRRVCGAVAGNGESLPRFQQKCIQVAEAAAALIMSDNGRRQ